MQCNKCGAFFPLTTQRCPICDKHVFLSSYSTSDVPNCDMYNNNVSLFSPDPHKKLLRDSYLSTVPEYAKAMHEKRMYSRYVSATILINIGIIIGTIILSSFSEFLSFLVPIGIAFAIVWTLYRLLKVNGKKIKMQHEEAQSHESKLHYYASSSVVGHSILHHIHHDDDGPDTYYYAFYEVDRDNIHSIGYDSLYGEYVLKLKKPIFFDKKPCPVYEYRIADIFDDETLSNVLCCDLPPKVMNF